MCWCCDDNIDVNIDVDSGVASPSEEDQQEGLEKVRGGNTKSRTQSGEDAGIGSEQGQSPPRCLPSTLHDVLGLGPRTLKC